MPSLQASVNKSGSSVNVYSDICGQGSVIGQLYNNEVFVVYGSSGSCFNIKFVNPSGNFVSGNVNDTNLPASWVTSITDYPYRMLSGYYIFKLRRSATVKNPSGTDVATLASGTEVACNSSTVGQTYNNYKHIVGVVNSTGTGINLTYNGYFVDMGFNYGSSGSTMTLYGTY